MIFRILNFQYRLEWRCSVSGICFYYAFKGIKSNIQNFFWTFVNIGEKLTSVKKISFLWIVSLILVCIKLVLSYI